MSFHASILRPRQFHGLAMASKMPQPFQKDDAIKTLSVGKHGTLPHNLPALFQNLEAMKLKSRAYKVQKRSNEIVSHKNSSVTLDAIEDSTINTDSFQYRDQKSSNHLASSQNYQRKRDLKSILKSKDATNCNTTTQSDYNSCTKNPIKC